MMPALLPPHTPPLPPRADTEKRGRAPLEADINVLSPSTTTGNVGRYYRL